RVGGLFVATAVFAATWVGAELVVPEPLVDMRVFVERQVLFTNLCALIAGFAMFGTFVLIPNFVETAASVGYGFGASATKAGVYLLPSSVALLFAGPVAGVIGKGIGFKWVLAAGMLLVAISAAMLAVWHDRPWEILASMPILGVGVGFAFAAMATLITEAVRASETGIATGMNTVMRTIGGVIGVQIGAAILTAYLVAPPSGLLKSGPAVPN